MSIHDQLLTVAEVAELLGIHEGTWRGYISRDRRNPGSNPAPQPLPGDSDPVTHRPRWRRSVVLEWNARRPKEKP